MIPAIAARLEQVFGKNIFSAQDLGWSKHRPEDFLAFAKKIGADPKSVVYLAHTIENTKAAQSAGYTAIQFFSREHTIEELSRLLSA